MDVASQSWDGGRPRPSVLIVEDEQVIAEDLRQMLVDGGYDPFAVVRSAEDAITRSAQRCPDVVLMDIRVAGQGDGIETAGLLRERFGIPVVFLAAHSDQATRERARAASACGFLLKPVHPGQLHSAIELALYRAAMERGVLERERWFAAAMHSVSDAVVTVDLAGNVTFMNAEAEQLTGQRLEDAIGQPAREIVRLIDPQRTGPDSPLDQAISDGQPVAPSEARVMNATTGSIRTISDHATPVFERGRTLGAVMVFRDITEQKKMEQQLELTDRLASLGTMAAGVAHEINNPVTVVISNACYLEDDLVRLRAELRGAGGEAPAIAARFDELQQAIGDIKSGGARIGAIVADLRAFVRPEPHAPGQADVARAVAWAVRSTATETHARAAVVIDLAAVPCVVGDEARLGQVLINVLVNAAHAIAPGHVDVNLIRISAAVDDRGRVVIEITDSGAGIPAEVRARIFEPFFTTKAVGVGTGLGLSISHGIVASMGGEMEVASEVGKGTTIRICLCPVPVATAPVAALAASSAPPVIRGRILVVDDDPMVLRTVRRVLAAHHVVCAESTAEALAVIDGGQTFDLIFAGLTMPAMNGIGLFEELLERSAYLARGVVFLTGGAMSPRSAAFLRSVANQRIDEPFVVETLLAVVSQRLAAAAARGHE